jgi:hypothetical protein
LTCHTHINRHTQTHKIMINTEELSLEELQKQFVQVQEEESTFRLSEYNIVELVNYLICTKRLKRVVFTLDGKEYVTEDQLRREIWSQILLSGGRINRTDLPELLNVDFSHIESICNNLLKEDRSLHLVQGEILTDEYLDSVCEEVNETLQESGVLYIGDLTKRLGLPSEFISHIISDRIHGQRKKIHGRLDNDILFTQGFIRRQKAKIRGSLYALTKPTPLLQVNPGIQESLFDAIVKDLLKEKRVFGTIHRGIFVPKFYEAAMDNAVIEFFNQNGYISFDRIESMLYFKSSTNATKNYIKEKLSDTIFVTSGVVSQSLCDTLDSSIEEALSNNTPLNIMTVVPSQLEKEDIRKMLAYCPSIEKYRQHQKKEPIVLFNGCYLMTTKNIDDLVQSFEERAKDDVKKLLSTQPKIDDKVANRYQQDTEEGEEDPKTKSKKGGKSSKKKSSMKRGARKNRDHELEQDFSSKKEEKALLALIPSKKEIIEQVQRILKDDAPSQYDDEANEIYDEVVEYLTPLLETLYLKWKESILLDASSDRRKQHQEFEKRIQELYYEILLNYKSINALIADKKKLDENSLKLKLEKYLIKTKCALLTFTIIQDQALHHQLTNDTTNAIKLLAEEDVDEDKLFNEMIKVNNDVLTRLPNEKDQEILKFLQNSLQNNPIEEFLDKLNATADHFNLFLRKLDKKKEKEFLNNKKKELQTMILPQIIDPTKLLLTLCVYLFLAKGNLFIHATGKFVHPLIIYLKNHLLKDEDQMLISLLDEAQRLVSKYIVVMRESDQALFDENSKLQEVLIRIKHLLGIKEEMASSLKESSNMDIIDQPGMALQDKDISNVTTVEAYLPDSHKDINHENDVEHKEKEEIFDNSKVMDITTTTKIILSDSHQDIRNIDSNSIDHKKYEEDATKTFTVTQDIPITISNEIDFDSSPIDNNKEMDVNTATKEIRTNFLQNLNDELDSDLFDMIKPSKKQKNIIPTNTKSQQDMSNDIESDLFTMIDYNEEESKDIFQNSSHLKGFDIASYIKENEKSNAKDYKGLFD